MAPNVLVRVQMLRQLSGEFTAVDQLCNGDGDDNAARLRRDELFIQLRQLTVAHDSVTGSSHASSPAADSLHGPVSAGHSA